MNFYSVFDSFTNREKGGEDRKIPRQARHPIQRKETEGNTAIRKVSIYHTVDGITHVEVNRGHPSSPTFSEVKPGVALK